MDAVGLGTRLISFFPRWVCIILWRLRSDQLSSPGVLFPEQWEVLLAGEYDERVSKTDLC